MKRDPVKVGDVVNVLAEGVPSALEWRVIGARGGGFIIETRFPDGAGKTRQVRRTEQRKRLRLAGSQIYLPGLE